MHKAKEVKLEYLLGQRDQIVDVTITARSKTCLSESVPPDQIRDAFKQTLANLTDSDDKVFEI